MMSSPSHFLERAGSAVRTVPAATGARALVQRLVDTWHRIHERGQLGAGYRPGSAWRREDDR